MPNLLTRLVQEGQAAKPFLQQDEHRPPLGDGIGLHLRLHPSTSRSLEVGNVSATGGPARDVTLVINDVFTVRLMLAP